MAYVALSSKAVGSIVKIKVNGALRNFIVVHQGRPSTLYDTSCDGTWLLMEDVYESRTWHSSNVHDYANSTIHSYLNSTFLNLIDANIRSHIAQAKIPYRPGSGTSTTVNSGANGLSAKILLLSAYEVGFTTATNQFIPIDGARLSYFEDGTGTSALNKRIARLNGTVTDWWLRSPSTSASTSAWYCNSGGNSGSRGCSGAYGVRPALILPSTIFVADNGTVTANTAPTTPGSINVPSTINGGDNIAISWAASTDAEGNLYGYKVEKSTDGGSSWSQIYQGTAISTTDNVAFGTITVMYRVKAYDTGGLESSWRTSGQVTVVNNSAPDAPSSITVPMTVNGGASLVISWGTATDSDGNLSGYELERQVDDESWEQIYRGDKLAFTDNITKGWETVAYRVRAYDDLGVAGAYTTSQTRTVNNNTAPTISSDSPSGSDLGTKAEGFTVDYSVNDVDADAVTVTEAIDGVVKRSFQAVLDQNCTLDVTSDAFMRVLNGKHTMTITAHDGQASAVHKLTFTKEVTAASITLETPMDADAEITLAALAVIGNIPSDAEYKVEVTNNGKDDQPVWQDVTAAVKTGANIIFENHTANNGFAFNFRVSVKRGENGQGGYITSVQGGFE